MTYYKEKHPQAIFNAFTHNTDYVSMLEFEILIICLMFSSNRLG